MSIAPPDSDARLLYSFRKLDHKGGRQTSIRILAPPAAGRRIRRTCWSSDATRSWSRYRLRRCGPRT